MMMTTMRSVHVRLQASKRRVNLMEKFKTDLLKDASGSEKLFPLSLESLERPKYSLLKYYSRKMFSCWTGGADQVTPDHTVDLKHKLLQCFICVIRT